MANWSYFRFDDDDDDDDDDDYDDDDEDDKIKNTYSQNHKRNGQAEYTHILTYYMNNNWAYLILDTHVYR